MPKSVKPKHRHRIPELIHESVGNSLQLQKELATFLGVHKQTVYRWYHNETSTLHPKHIPGCLIFFNQKRPNGSPEVTVNDLYVRPKTVDVQQLKDDLNLSS